MNHNKAIILIMLALSCVMLMVYYFDYSIYETHSKMPSAQDVFRDKISILSNGMDILANHPNALNLYTIPQNNNWAQLYMNNINEQAFKDCFSDDDYTVISTMMQQCEIELITWYNYNISSSVFKIEIGKTMQHKNTLVFIKINNIVSNEQQNNILATIYRYFNGGKIIKRYSYDSYWWLIPNQ